jgi:hypothetical protein
MKKIIFLAADKNIEFAVKGLLSRPQSLYIKALLEDDYRILRYGKDPGTRLQAHEFLRPFFNEFAYAMVLFDREGSGQDSSRSEIEKQVEENLAKNGWENRAAVIVLDPTIEAWVWSDSPHVAETLGWQNRNPDLKQWLIEQDYLTATSVKPASPKQALTAALREAGQQRSSVLFHRLASKVGLDRCRDPAFEKFKSTLARWFPP